MQRPSVLAVALGLLSVPAVETAAQSRDALATPAQASLSVRVWGRVMAGDVPVVGATVAVPGSSTSALTDTDGAYVLDLDPRVARRADVAVEVRAGGYRAVQHRLPPGDGDRLRLDVSIEPLPADSDAAGEAPAWPSPFGMLRHVRADGEAPRWFDPHGPSAPPVVEQPARTIEALAALAPSVVRDDRTDSLDVRGTVPPWTLDGIALPRGARLPLGLVASLDVQPGALSASDAAGRGGRLALASRDGRAEPALRIDARGQAVGTDRRWVDLGGYGAGTLLGDRVRIAAGLRVVRTDDPSPSAQPLPRLTDDAFDRLRGSPQMLRVESPDGRVRFVPLGALSTGMRLSDVAPGADPARVTIVDAVTQMAETDLTTSPGRPGAARAQNEGFVRVGLALPFALDADVLHTRTHDDGERFIATAALLEPGQARTADGTDHARLRLTTRRFGLDLAATLARTAMRQTDYRDGFGRDVRATLGYHDIDDPRNATARAYVRLQQITSSSRPATADSVRLQPLYGDGAFPSAIGIYGLYSQPGALTTGYAMRESRTTTARIDARRFWGGDAPGGSHHLDLGADIERTVERGFSIGIAGVRRLATFVGDSPPGTSGRPACDFDATGSECLSTYDDFGYNVLNGYTSFVGYRYNGLGRANTRGDLNDVAAYAACSAAATSGGCAEGPAEAPARATRGGGWVGDRATVGRLVVDAGLRVDVFGRGGLALVDPYSLLPIVRAGDAGLTTGRVGDDWAVYYSGTVVRGFRDLDGHFYRPDGTPAETPNEVIVNAGVSPRRLDPQGPVALDARAFRAPRMHVAWQPRVAASFAIGTDASLFAYAASTAEAPPSGLAHVSFTDYRTRLEGSGDLGNPDLAPLRTTTFGVGGRGGAGRLALSAEFWLARDTDLPVAVRRRYVFPGTYLTVESGGQQRRWGAEASADWRFGPRTRFALSYALVSAGEVAVFDWGWLRDYDPALVQTAVSRRHSGLARLVTATSDAAGPALGPVRPLASWTLDAALMVATGRPYARLAAPYSLAMPVGLTGYRSTATLPPTARLDLAVARTLVRVAGARVDLTVRAENVLGRRNVRRVWRATGQPDEDGYLATDAGRHDSPPGTVSTLLYQTRLVDAMNYGIGRIVHVGLRWTR